MRVRLITIATLVVTAVACDQTPTAPIGSPQASPASPPSANLAALNQSGERTPFQQSIAQTIAERQAQGLPVPTATYEYEEIAPLGIAAQAPGAVTVVAKTVIAFDSVQQSGLAEWPTIVVAGDVPEGATGFVRPGDYTQFAKDEISKRYPDAWTGVTFESGARTYTVAETLAVKGSQQLDELMDVRLQGLETVTSMDQVLLGFTLNGPGIDYHVSLDVDICIIWFFGCRVEIELVSFWAGFVLDWTIGARLPMATNVFSLTALKEVGSFPLSSSSMGMDWNAADFTAVGVNPENGNEYVLKFDFGAGVFLTVVGYDAVNIGVQPMSLNSVASFATPLDPGHPLTLPSLAVPLWGFNAAVADASIDLSLTPRAGSDRYTADWLVTAGGSGSGTATYTRSGDVIPLGTVSALDGPDSADVQLSGFRYYFNQFYLDLGINFTFHVLSWGNTFSLPLTDFDLSSVLGHLYVGPHSGTTGTLGLQLLIENVAPTVALSRNGTVSIHGVPTFLAGVNQVSSFSGEASDPGRDDLTLTWDWNDGPPSPGDVTTYPVPYQVTETRTHEFQSACLYQVGLRAVDDDQAVGEDGVLVLVTGGVVTDGRREGYWQHQFGRNGHTDYSDGQLECYLGIVRHVSGVFGGQRSVESLAAAYDVLHMAQNGGDPREQLDRELLVAWLNFAAGAIAYDGLVDENGDGTADVAYATAMATIEAARLDPATTDKEIRQLTARVHRINVKSVS
jgi:hypothetical protein